jgi:hypothetical protein
MHDIKGTRMFSELDNYLTIPVGSDYWSDEGIDIASAMLIKFSDQDWTELSTHCALKPVEWQVRCAEILDSVPNPISVEILVKFLRSDCDEVVVAAADSLRSIGNVEISADSLNRVTHLAESGSALIQMVLADFLKRIGSDRKSGA